MLESTTYSSGAPGEDAVAACIVVYHPDESVLGRIAHVAKQLDKLIVVDNSPENVLSLVCQAAVDKTLPDNAIVVRNANRGGVSGAINEALIYCRQRGINDLFLFDQDTDLPATYIASMLRIMSVSGVSALGPRFLNSSTGAPGRIVKYESKWRMSNVWPAANSGEIDATFLINSGCLLNLRLIDATLFYDEQLPVDFSDIDFFCALRAAGGRAVCTTAVTVSHAIGNRVAGSSRWSATNYPASRKRLAAQARSLVYRRYASVLPGFILNDLIVFIGDALRTLAFETAKWEKLKAILGGTFAGFSLSILRRNRTQISKEFP